MNTANDPQPRVVCFGEILWDFLPDALYPGGAPFNVAYHLSRHGCGVHLVSAVGDDALGDELRRRVAAWGIDTSGLRRHPVKPTGYVRARLSPDGSAAYEITRNVAWDAIAPGKPSLAAAGRASAIVFGSLAQRTPANRRALAQLIEALPAGALRVFDVNLRPPYVDPPLLQKLARHASLLKLNASEAAELAGKKSEEPGREERDARNLFEHTGCRSIVITAGARGAGWLRDGLWYWEPGRRVKVVDTIGAGDAFLATLVAGLLLEPAAGPATLLAAACRRGEWVARHRGATPAYR